MNKQNKEQRTKKQRTKNKEHEQKQTKQRTMNKQTKQRTKCIYAINVLRTKCIDNYKLKVITS